MNISGDNLVSMKQASENFARVARMVDEKGSVVIMNNDVPRYLLIEFDKAEGDRFINDEELLEISNRLIEKNREAYEELAK